MVRMVVLRYKSYLQSYIMFFVEEDFMRFGNDLSYILKGLEMKLKIMFQSKEEIEKIYKCFYFVNKVMDLEVIQNFYLIFEVI